MRTNSSPPLKGLEIWAVEWEDAHWDSGEMGREDIVHMPILYVSVGILLRDDDGGVTLATDVAASGTFRGLNYIPPKMITKKWKIGNVGPRTPRIPKPRAAKSQTSVDTLQDVPS